MKTFPLTYVANGGFFLEEVTMISPKMPSLYRAGRLVSSKGSQLVLVRKNGCIRQVYKFSCMIFLQGLPVLFSSMQLSRSTFIRSILRFYLAPDKWMKPGLLVKWTFFWNTWLQSWSLGWGMGQQLLRSSVAGMNIISMSSIILLTSSFTSFMSSIASSSKVLSQKFSKASFLEESNGPIMTKQFILVLYRSFRVLSSLSSTFKPMLSIESFFMNDPLTKSIRQAIAGYLTTEADPLKTYPKLCTFSNLKTLSAHTTSISAIIPTQTVPFLTSIFSLPVQSSTITSPSFSLDITLRIIFDFQSLSLTLPIKE